MSLAAGAGAEPPAAPAPHPDPAAAGWVAVAPLRDLERRKKLLVDAAGAPVALFWVEGQVFAFHDVCIHKQRSLSKGLIFQGRVVCPGHQWAFDLNTGWQDEAGQCQPTHAVKVEDGVVFVDPRPRVRDRPPDDSERYGGGG